MNEYALVKLVHLGALIFWLGPPLGAWLVFKAVGDNGFQAGSVGEKVNRIFFYTILLEHVAFVALLATGAYMVYAHHWLGVPWLTQKLTIVLLIIVPLEVVDIALGNCVASRVSKRLYMGRSVKLWERKALAIYHGPFTKVALLVIPVSVIAVMYLAISKEGF